MVLMVEGQGLQVGTHLWTSEEGVAWGVEGQVGRGWQGKITCRQLRRVKSPPRPCSAQ